MHTNNAHAFLCAYCSFLLPKFIIGKMNVFVVTNSYIYTSGTNRDGLICHDGMISTFILSDGNNWVFLFRKSLCTKILNFKNVVQRMLIDV